MAEAQKDQNTRIFYEKEYRTFRLYPGNSLYAFCISPEGSLEHLYWGSTLPRGYDLRYLCQSSRMTVFNTYELPSDVDVNRNDTNLLQSSAVKTGNFHELTESWRRFNAVKTSDSSTDDNEYFHNKRMENLAWRLMAIKNAESKKKSKSNSDLLTASGLKDEDAEPLQYQKKERQRSQNTRMSWGRSRSRSNPMLMHMQDFDDNERLGKRKENSEDDHEIAPHTRSRANSSTMRNFDRKVGDLGKGVLSMEYSDYGTGDFRTPSFVVSSGNGGHICPLKYKLHYIQGGKTALPDSLPGVRVVSPKDATTLIVTMEDTISGIEVDLIYICLHDYDAITRRVVFRNVSQSDQLSLYRMCSLTLDIEVAHKPFYLTQLAGSWARERMVVESELSQGTKSFGSLRGVSSHQHNPFAIITAGEPNEEEGEAKGFTLLYSGNFLFEASVDDMGRLRVNMGIHPLGFKWDLNPNDTFNTPEALLVRGTGIGGMSRTLHRIILDKLILPSWADADPTAPPILLNSWEAKYFNVNHAGIVDMARQAVSIGADLLVLDDGWFGFRNDDSTSLGDWVPNLIKFPHGLDGLAREINHYGIKFGIWVEPEMVSESSDLYRKHPDWCLHVPGRPKQIGRNQMVLDLSRPEVRDYLFDQLAALLDSANIEYVKWDMNRPLTEVYSQMNNGNVEQGETSHRFVLGVYDLQARIMTNFPHILLENCASGGGRFDLGMLYFSPQIWCSDNTDALTRMRIQYGTSFSFPARCIGAHVSCIPNHITGNYTRARTRGYMAMCGTFGFELDVAKCNIKEISLFKEQSTVYRSVAYTIRSGDLYRLWNPFKSKFASWMYVSRNKKKAVVFAFSMGSDHWSNVVPRLCLQGLDPETQYEVTEPLPNNLAQQSGNLMIIETEVPVYQLGYRSVTLSGSILMNAGLPVKFYTFDDSVMFVITKI